MADNIKLLEKTIQHIGDEIVTCKNQCSGITNDPISGRIPRCIFFDLQDSSKTNGCVIVGINPGIMKENSSEQQHYLKHKNDLSYSTIFEQWNDSDKEHNYYKFLRKFVNNIGLDGPILWTELVKCEKRSTGVQLPLQTARICTNTYLLRELREVPQKWLIIAVGREAHKALSYLYPTRSILGVPHPTSSRGHFNKLYLKNRFGEKFRKVIKTQIDAFLITQGEELWLSQSKKKV